eukprot:3160244-Prymnesium_polylepis.1
MDIYQLGCSVARFITRPQSIAVVTVPVELLLAVNLQMPPRTGPNGPVLRKYMEQGGVVLRATGRVRSMADLHMRKISSDF